MESKIINALLGQVNYGDCVFHTDAFAIFTKKKRKTEKVIILIVKNIPFGAVKCD